MNNNEHGHHHDTDKPSGCGCSSKEAPAAKPFSFVVLVGAGLLVRTFINLQRVDSGFEENGVLVVKAPNLTRFCPMTTTSDG